MTMWIPGSATERLGQDQAVAHLQSVVAPNLAPPVKEWVCFHIEPINNMGFSH